MTMRIRLTGALTALALLAGCGGGAGLGAALQGGLASLTGTGGAAASAAAAPAGTAADPATLRRVELATIGIVGTAQQLTASGGRETFAGPEGFTYTLHDGMLVSTRGLSHDLMAADTRQSRAALRAGGGEALRVHETLDGLDRIVRSEFACTITARGAETIEIGNRRKEARRFDENCRGEGVIFDNRYWIDGSGRIVSSRQFVNLSVAYLRSSDL
ncbi:YjbF family lipoprotein [Limimaricola variabilis]|uniref:YjbF family lipoprotein n=1 Tax=Limimaricola variabilis TaxID=1492771 RepID=UPI002AC94AFA|nr:YjbF family lipoprotein [Limimaricola variabilis]WPY93539.1 YjbF family lipoprotein [Limimaricola variabilis]